MQEAFEKLKGIDIFALKSYMEETSWGSFNGIWVMVNEIFVNFPFFLLNLIVGFFSITKIIAVIFRTVIRFIEFASVLLELEVIL